MRKKIILILTIFLMSVSLFGASSNYPKKNITVIVPYSAGGGSDQVSRALAKILQKELKKPVNIINKVGAGGGVGMTYGAKSKQDGYTVTMLAPEITILPYTSGMKIKYSDFEPMAIVNSDPAAITVKSDSEIKTIEEFIEYAKKNPSKVRIGNSGVGSIWHLAGAEFAKKTGTKLIPVPFAGAAPAVAALLGGHIEATSVSLPEVQAQVRSGDLRVLAVMADDRIKGFENIPTLKEKGIDVSVKTWRGYAVPKGTPEDIRAKLEKAIVAAANSKEFKDFMSKVNQGVVILEKNDFIKQLESDNKTFEVLLEDLNLKK